MVWQYFKNHVFWRDLSHLNSAEISLNTAIPIFFVHQTAIIYIYVSLVRCHIQHRLLHKLPCPIIQPLLLYQYLWLSCQCHVVCTIHIICKIQDVKHFPDISKWHFYFKFKISITKSHLLVHLLTETVSYCAPHWTFATSTSTILCDAIFTTD